MTALGPHGLYAGRTIIAGSRSLTDYELVEAAVEASGFTITEVISGAARGIDQLGERWAEAHGVPVRRFPANWEEHGRAAGPIRNREMIAVADTLIAIWNGSPGTEDVIRQARRAGLRIYVSRVGDAYEG
jgi:hypothetical protein